MNLALILLKTGQYLVSQVDELDYEPRVHLTNPFEITGKTKVVLSSWPSHTGDDHFLLKSEDLLTVCEPTEAIGKKYAAKVGKKLEDFNPEPPEAPILLNEDENVVEGENVGEDDYEPFYTEE